MKALGIARSRAGFTLLEMLIVITVIGILAAITAPFLMAAKSAANEASAIGSLRTVNTAQAAFHGTCGSGTYSPTFAHLVTGGYAGPDLDLTPKSGFGYRMTPALGGRPGAVDCTGAATQGDYYASAVPLSGNTGRRGFATNQLATIWQNMAGAAPVEPFVETATVAPLRGE
jgi:prepilin-type N-terminal cleavage/methylation domain-containing protein